MIEKRKTFVDINPPSTQNIWQDILREAMTKKDLEESHIFVFGDKFVGKHSLIKIINKELLQKNEFEEKKILNFDDSGAKYSLIDYTYLNIKKIHEQDTESIGKMNIWLINEMIEKDHFESVIKPDFLLKSLCIIMVDLTRPWDIIESLKKWINFIYDTFSHLILNFPLEKQNDLRQQVEEYIKLYEEPQFDEEGNIRKDQISEETNNLKLELPLKEGLLRTNIGIPVVFVINKSDIVLQSGERKRYEEDSDFILKHIRSLSLTYGASIIYTSTKQNTNLSLLYEYILHRIYKFDLLHKPNVMDKDAFFVPAGFDSLQLLKSNDVNNDLNKLFEEKITFIKPKNIIREEEVICEDINSFLAKYKNKGKSNTLSRSDYKTNTDNDDLKDESSRDILPSPKRTTQAPDFTKFYDSNNSKSSSLDNYSSNMSTTKTSNLNEKKLDLIRKNQADKLLQGTNASDSKAKESLKRKLEILKNQK